MFILPVGVGSMDIARVSVDGKALLKVKSWQCSGGGNGNGMDRV